jgi:predicted nucleotidyltransferase
MNVEPVIRVLQSIGAPHALIGAHAMAARGYPRFTIDVDLLTSDNQVLVADTWAGLVSDEAEIDIRRGDHDDPLGGVVHLLLADGTDVDLVLAKWKWEADLIDRAESLSIGGISIRVPRTGDLILLKLAAGGFIDLQDAKALLLLGDVETVIRDVEAHVDEVRPDVRALWRDLRAASER